MLETLFMDGACLDAESCDQMLEEECLQDDQMANAYLGYREARDVLNQVKRSRGFWPVVAIPIGDHPPPVKTWPIKGKGKSKGKGKPKTKGRTRASLP